MRRHRSDEEIIERLESSYSGEEEGERRQSMLKAKENRLCFLREKLDKEEKEESEKEKRLQTLGENYGESINNLQDWQEEALQVRIKLVRKEEADHQRVTVDKMKSIKSMRQELEREAQTLEQRLKAQEKESLAAKLDERYLLNERDKRIQIIKEENEKKIQTVHEEHKEKMQFIWVELDREGQTLQQEGGAVGESLAKGAHERASRGAPQTGGPEQARLRAEEEEELRAERRRLQGETEERCGSLNQEVTEDHYCLLVSCPFLHI